MSADGSAAPPGFLATAREELHRVLSACLAGHGATAARLTDAVWRLIEAAHDAGARAPGGGCRTCGSGTDQPHRMTCDLYVGPLRHDRTEVIHVGEAPGFIASCTCGWYYPLADGECPDGDRAWRGRPGTGLAHGGAAVAPDGGDVP